LVRNGNESGGLQVDPALSAFVAEELVSGVGLSPGWFWTTLAQFGWNPTATPNAL